MRVEVKVGVRGGVGVGLWDEVRAIEGVEVEIGVWVTVGLRGGGGDWGVGDGRAGDSGGVLGGGWGTYSFYRHEA